MGYSRQIILHAAMLLVCGVCPAFCGSPAEPCIQAGETVYVAGENGVKDPKLRLESTASDQAIVFHSKVVIEVTINSKGRICEITPLISPDTETAKALAQHVADNFRFSPATRKGKRVSARFKVVFNPPSDGR